MRYRPGIRRVVFKVCIAVMVFAGCGPEPMVQPDAGGATDGSSEPGSDGGGADGTQIGLDAADVDDDADAGGDGDIGGDAGGDTPDADAGGGSHSEAPDQWLRCNSDVDCPIRGAKCVKTVAYNRADHTDAKGVTVSEVLEGLSEGEGICTQTCSNEPSNCAALKWDDEAGGEVQARCHVIAEGASPYALAGESNFEEQMKRGRAFAAVCLPPIETTKERSDTLCQSCKTQDECSAETECINLKTDKKRASETESGRSVCAPSCQQTTDCALGFECVETGENAKHCLPQSRTCTGCVDRDGDGYGTGHCGPNDARQTPHDCDDRKEYAYYEPSDMEHPFPMYCGMHDYNCNGRADSEEQVGSEQYPEEHCTACDVSCPEDSMAEGQFACKKRMGNYACVQACEEGKTANCTIEKPTDTCEVTVAKAKIKKEWSKYLYWEDADGDGHAANDARGYVFCTQAEAKAWEKKNMKTLAGQKGDCKPKDANTYPGASEICDGVDNDCGTDSASADRGCDSDGDGWCDADMTTVGKPKVCPNGGGDCNDNRDTTYPGSAEKDSTTKCMKDADGDGYGSSTPHPGVPSGSDCDDTRDSINPGETERCNGWDDDCSGKADDGSVTGKNAAGTSVTSGNSCKPDTRGVCATDANGTSWEYRCKVSSRTSSPSKSATLSCYHPDPKKPADEKPGFDGKDHNCDGVDRYASTDGGKTHHAVWVKAGTSGSGKTPRRPTGDLEAALKTATNASWCKGKTANGKSRPCDVYVSTQTVAVDEEGLELREGVDIYGAINDSNWGSWSSGSSFAVNRVSGSTTVEIDAPRHSQPKTGGDVRGVFGANIDRERTVLDGLDITSKEARMPGASVYGLRCHKCPKLYLQNVNVTAGNAKAGTDGSDGRNGPDGRPGGSDRTAYTHTSSELDGKSCIQGRSSFRYDWVAACKALCRRKYGSNTSGGRACIAGNCTVSTSRLEDYGEGGTWKSDGHNFVQADGGNYTSESTRNFENGDGGNRLLNPPAFGGDSDRFSLDGSGGSMSVTDGAMRMRDHDGQDGLLGDGGGGGAGDWFRLYLSGRFEFFDHGGGSGGCPGLGGEGGTTGGHSVGMVLVDSTGITLKNTRINAGNGGKGGNGGDGGDGGEGKRGGVSSTAGVSAGYGGDGAGGDGGAGGGGGHSFGCFLVGTTLSGVNPGGVCTKGTAGAKGRGGKGGKCGNGKNCSSSGRNGEAGKDGHDGRPGMVCNFYRETNYSSGTSSIRFPNSRKCKH